VSPGRAGPVFRFDRCSTPSFLKTLCNLVTAQVRGGWSGRQGLCISKKIFQKAMDIYIAIQSVCLCAYLPVMFPHIVLIRLNMSSYFLQHMAAQSLNLFQY